MLVFSCSKDETSGIENEGSLEMKYPANGFDHKPGNIFLTKKQRMTLFVFAAAVVFAVTYLLVLPAFTLDEEEAIEQGGIDVPATEEQISEEQTTEEPAAEGQDTEKQNAEKETDADPANQPAELSFEGDGYNIALDADAKAGLPEGTQVSAEEVTSDAEDYDAWCDETLKALQEAGQAEDNTTISSARFYDISLLADGEAIEPQSAVGVRISYDKAIRMKSSEGLRVVHFAADENGELQPEVLDEDNVDIKAEDGSGTVKVSDVAFEAAGFSMYAIVGTETIETDYLAADGETYHIEVTLDERDAISGNAELVVKELEEGSDAYINYLAYASESMMLDSVDDIRLARFFDVTILNDGKKYEPEHPAQVKITYQDAIDVGEDEVIKAVHFAKAGAEIIEDVDLEENGTQVTYEQNGFSVTGTVVTNAGSLVSGEKYVIYTQSGGNYYAISHASDGRDQDTVYPIKLDSGSTNNNGTISVQNAGENIIWTVTKVGNNYRFFYEAEGNTYYLRTYGGVMVGADSDIDEDNYRQTNRYTWSYNNNRYLRTLSNDNNNSRYLGYSSNVIKERANNSNAFYFARVTDVTSFAPRIHYVDESGNELEVVNGRDWTSDSSVSPAFLIYDIDGYEYVKTTLTSVNGTTIRPILRQRASWQYTTSTSKSNSITWTDIPMDAQDPGQLEDIYVVYKKAKEPVSGGIPKVKPSGSTENPVGPAIHKTSVSNGDGTNTLGLSITADTSPLEVEKLADVIVIYDVSSSMRRHMGTSTTTYESNSTPVKNYTDHQTRMWIAAEAVNSLADTLIGDNTEFKDSAGNKLIRMSLISFSDKAALEQDFTSDISDYKAAVGDLHTNTGTNWEDALRMANSMQVDPERATFVIFVTDGNPSYRATRGNLLNIDGYPETVNDAHLDIYADNSYYMYRANAIFGGLNENDERNYNSTLDVAKSIVDHNKNYYAIGVGPTSGVTRLQGLTTYAYDDADKGADRTKNATDSDELTKAFNEITASIVALLGWGDINMTDGITSLANTVEKAKLVNVDGNFEYWKAPAPEGWGSWNKKVRSGYILGTSGQPIEYPDDYDSWSAADKNGYVTAYNQGKSLAQDDFTSWNPATENCERAYYDEESGSVKWDMGHNFVPESGCTYKVTFRVWPSQEAYDILANLKNGTMTYDGLTDAQKAQIIDLGNGNYSLKTNDKEPNTTYKAARKTGDGVTTTGDTQTLMFNDVGPMPLVPEKLTVKKDWDYDIGETHKAVSLDFRVMVGEKYYQNDGSFKSTTDNAKILPVSEATEWKNSINIAAGLVIFDKNGNATVLETGHDYRLDEFNVQTGDDTPFDASYEFTTQTVRPMILTVEDNDSPYHATLAYLVKIDENNPAVPGKDQFTIGDSTYYVASTGSEGTVVGTNHRKAELDITKHIIDNSGNMTESDLDDETFTYRVTLTVPKDTDCSQMTAYEFVYRADDDPRLNGNTPFKINGYQEGDGYIEGDENKSGAHYRSFTVKKGNTSIADSFTVNADNKTKSMTMDITLKRAEVLRFTNLPSGTTYTIQEMYADYRQADPSRDADATGSTKASNIADMGYSTTYKTKKTTDTETAGGTGTTVEGTITDLDIRYYNQFTNTLNNAADAELKVKKALEGLNWTSGSRYYFKLTAVDGAPLPVGVGSNTGRTQFYISSDTPDHTYSFGRIRYTEAGTYQYKITETDSSWNSIAGQLIDGIQYAPEETITVKVEKQNGRLVVTEITGSSGNTVVSKTQSSSLTAATTTITNSSALVDVPIRKIDSKTKTLLNNAVFELRNGSEKLYFDSEKNVLTSDQVKAIIGMDVTVDGADAAMAAAGISSTFTIGEVTLHGLALNTTYTLKEVDAPAGYIIAENDATFTLTKDDSGTHIAVTGANASVDSAGVTILISNEAGAQLPSSGGPGTTWIYLIGSILLLGCGITLIARRRIRA